MLFVSPFITGTNDDANVSGFPAASHHIVHDVAEYKAGNSDITENIATIISKLISSGKITC